jgi:TetR/AcrR family transcriptional repressor of nem operon
VLEAGRQAGELGFPGTAIDQARFVLYSLEGAMLVARSYGDPARLTTAVDRLLRGLK